MSEPVLNVSEGKQTGYVSLSLRVVFHIRNGSNLGLLSLECNESSRCVVFPAKSFFTFYLSFP